MFLTTFLQNTLKDLGIQEYYCFMLSIVLAILMGIGFTFIALQNPSPVPINLFGTAMELPLYLFAAISFLAGIFVALVFQLFDAFATSLNISQRNSEIKRMTKTNENLQYQLTQMNIENKRLENALNNRNHDLRREHNEQRKQEIRGFFTKLREGLT